MPASSPASRPAFSGECTQPPASARSGRAWLAPSARAPTPPVDHCTTRYLLTVPVLPVGPAWICPTNLINKSGFSRHHEPMPVPPLAIRQLVASAALQTVARCRAYIESARVEL